MNHLIAPSLLSANFLNLAKDIDMINRSEADWFHLDVMDGLFVPNISFGFSIIKQIKSLAKKPLDVHLMIVKPERYIQSFKQVGADWLSVQFEACVHLHRTLAEIKTNDMKAGVVLNPHTTINNVENVINDVDLVLLMSVNPGFGGQSFIENTYEKISLLKELILKKNSKALIQVDGGVDGENAEKIIKAGADVLVAGNYVFSSKNPINTIKKLKKI
ncbi:MAG: ribulose-phosphate 3-epimerase [Bacteroidales bacterium]|nr:ribulose-phosphate 3-epimerase [Bacteroidales bacterium]